MERPTEAHKRMRRLKVRPARGGMRPGEIANKEVEGRGQINRVVVIRSFVVL